MRGRGKQQEVLEVSEAVATLRAKEAFSQGLRAVLPGKDESDKGGIQSLAGICGVLPEHPYDRFLRYESIGAFLHACDQRPAGDRKDDDGYTLEQWTRLHRAPHLDSEWEGLAWPLPFAEVATFLRDGWTEGAEKIEAAMQRVTPPPAMDRRRRGAWSDRGDELSTDRLYAGNFESAWRTTRKTFTFAPQRIRIAVDLGSTCGRCATVGHNATYLDPRSLFWRGAAAASLADCLESAGYRVEIVVAGAVANTQTTQGDIATHTASAPRPTGRDELSTLWVYDMYRDRGYWDTANTAAFCVVVKDADAPMNLSTVASATASAAMYRRAGLLWVAATAHPEENVSNCFGAMVAVEGSPRVRAELGIDTEGTATLFVSQWVLTERLANAWARGALYGIESLRTGLTADAMTEDEDMG